MKKPILISAITLVTLVAVLLIAPSMINWNKYRGQISQLASDSLGVEVLIDGDVSLRLLPSPSLNVEQIRFLATEANTTTEIASLNKISLRLKAGALLVGDIEVNELRLIEPTIALAEDSAGKWAIKGWPASNDEVAASSATSPVAIDKFRLSGGSLIIERAGGQRLSLQDFNMKAEGKTPDGPLNWQGTVNWNEVPVAFEGRWQHRQGFDPGDDNGSLRLQATIPGGEMELSGRVSVNSANYDTRIRLEGHALSEFVTSLNAMSGSELVMQGVDSPFVLDAKLRRTGLTGDLTSRRLNIGSASGSLQATITFGSETYIASKINIAQIDLDTWLKATYSGAVAPQEKTEPLAITADMDISVGSLRWNGEAIQRLDASLHSRDGSFEVNKFQALLPGGGALTGTAKYNPTGTSEGVFSLNGGNGRPLLAWFGMPVEKFAAERFTALSIGGQISLQDNAWTLSVLKGKVDTTNFDLQMSGLVGDDEKAPIMAAINIDALNIDRYQPTVSSQLAAAEEADGIILPAFNVTVKVSDITYRNQRFTALAVALSGGETAVKLESLSANGFGKGTLKASGTVGGPSSWDQIDISAEARQVLGRQVARFAGLIPGEIPRRMQGALHANLSLRGNNAGYDISLKVGPTDGAGDFTALGRYVPRGDDAADIDLQGVIRDSYAAPWARDVGLPLNRTAGNIDLIYSVSRSQGLGQYKASGAVAGGRLIMDGTADNEGRKFRINYSRDNLTGMASKITRTLGKDAVQKPLSMKAVVTQKPTVLKVSDLDITLGDMRISGGISQQTNNKIEGNILLSGITWAGGEASKPAARTWSNTAFDLPDLSMFEGLIALKVKNLNLYGQRFDSEDASVKFDAGTVKLSVISAKMNSAPMTADMSFVITDELAIEGQLAADTLDLNGLMASMVGTAPLTGSTNIDLTFKASGNSEKALVASLDGSIESKGQAGTLNFINILALTQQVGNASSGAGFIRGLGNSLAGGITSFSDLNIAIDIKNGMADLTQFEALGSWGQLRLSGMTNLLTMTTDLSGQLQMTNPPDSPPIPVNYAGALSGPEANWQTDALQSFVMSGIRRRLRSDLFQGANQRSNAGEDPAKSPGETVTSTAIGFIKLLQQKRAAEAARKKAAAEEAARKKAAEEGANP